ncbi:MAG TPA: hypothetical protein VMS71_07120 [Candidatus Acidoferrum sp.]|nr:hypothetical protein [Candidatus Acidoferrum sp.]
MAKETKPNADPAAPNAAQPDAAQAASGTKASGKPSAIKRFLPYIIYGASGLVLIGIIAFGTLFFLKGKATPTTATADSTGTSVATVDSNQMAADVEDSLLALTDLGSSADTGEALEKLIQNIQAMDVKADTVAASDSADEAGTLSKERDALDRRKAELDARQKLIDATDKQVTAKLQKLEQMSNDRVTNLAKLYDGMDPTAVAKLMANLDDSIVVAIIPRMKQKNASEVLSLIPPQRAAKLSKDIITLAGD